MMGTWIGEIGDNYEVGQVGFLICRTDCNHIGVKYSLWDRPAHTNMSHQPKLSGWCGTTNNICLDAHGLARIVRVARNGRALVVGLTDREQAAALQALGYPDLS
jgi:hypothetical protein